MTLTIELTAEEEARLCEEAATAGLPAPEYARQKLLAYPPVTVSTSVPTDTEPQGVTGLTGLAMREPSPTVAGDAWRRTVGAFANDSEMTAIMEAGAQIRAPAV
jgi:hypothetical protein